MKKLIVLILVFVFIAAAVVIGPPLERAVNDTKPTSAEKAGTVVIDLPAPVLPAAIVSDTPPKPQLQPLAADLVTVADSEIRVPEGLVVMPPGIKVALVKDRGESVDVKLGNAVVTVPREAVAASAPLADAPVVSPYKSAIMEPIEKVLYAPAASLTISAHEIGTGQGIEQNWQTSWGSYDRDYYRTKGLEVEVRNISRRDSGDCQVSVYWMARTLADRSIHVHHGETIPAGVKGISSTTLRFWCPLLPANVAQYVALGKRTVAGSKIDGWFVMVSRGSRTLCGYSPSPTYQRMLENPAELGPILAAYTPSGRTATAEMPHWRHDPVRDEWRSRLSPNTQ